jgi:hypothetical protein
MCEIPSLAYILQPLYLADLLATVSIGEADACTKGNILSSPKHLAEW